MSLDVIIPHVMRKLVSKPRLFAGALLTIFAGGLAAADPATDRPEVAIASRYVKAVVAQDWTTCATMLAPKALQGRKNEMLAFIKQSRTMTEENSKLEALGLATYGDLEKLTPQQFYVLERTALNKKNALSEDSKQRQIQTLKIEVISVGAEDEGHLSHVLLRSHRETLDRRVHELLLVSLLQDPLDKDKCWILPDAQLPVAEPLGTSSEAVKPTGSPAH
jgi:hypothetical protein